MIGSDCEVFVIGPNGKPVSAIGMIGGSKDNPRKTDHGSVQEDNVLAEFNVIPAKSKAEFVRNFNAVVNDLRKILPEGHSLSFTSSARFEVAQLSHELAMEAGCTPDYDAWKLVENSKPDLSGTNLRTAGGHIHVSWDWKDMDDQVNMIRAMDMYLGLPSLILDDDVERRKIYGKAGAFRMKDYGVEWRTGSNFWARTNKRIAWAYSNTMRALEEKDKFKKGMEWVKDIINEGDKEAALIAIDQYQIQMP